MLLTCVLKPLPVGLVAVHRLYSCDLSLGGLGGIRPALLASGAGERRSAGRSPLCARSLRLPSTAPTGGIVAAPVAFASA